MRAVIQRVDESIVTVDGKSTGAISKGLLVLVAVGAEDDLSDLAFVKKKILNLRIFEDEDGKMNRSVREVEGEILLVPQFTLYGDCRTGNRPSYSRASPPQQAKQLYTRLLREIRSHGIRTESGKFRARMKVHLVNDGPVTLLVDSKREVY